MNSINEKEFFEFRILIEEALNGTIEKQELLRFQQILRSDSQARTYYIEYIHLYSDLIHQFASREIDTIVDFTGCPEGSKAGFDSTIWELLSQEEVTAPECVITPVVQPVLRELDYHIEREKTNTKISKRSLFTAIFSAAALIFILVLVNLPTHLSEPPEIAIVADSIDAQWDPTLQEIHVGDSLYNNTDDFRHLLSGLVTLRYAQGVEIVIEGPAQFLCTSQRDFYMRFGRAVAHVPKQMSGFTLKTPSARVVDLGTEFGIDVDMDGQAIVQMYQGKASLVSRGYERDRMQQILTCGQARKVNPKTAQIEKVEMQPNLFVRKIDSKSNIIWSGQMLSLADIVGNGDGFGTGALEAGIIFSQEKGEMIDFKDNELVDEHMQKERKSPAFDLIEHPYIDAVFVPTRTKTASI